MKSNRREFLRNVGAGATALGLTAALPATAAAAAADKAKPAAAAKPNKVVKAADTFPNQVGAGRKKMMWPIQNDMKSVRLKHDAPIDPVSWAYMKELREHNKTKKVYPINPYVEVYQFRKNLYGLFAHNLDGGGDVWMFLTVGPEKALLVDTAYGLGDLKGLCDQISGNKPLIVVNTHEHYDHAFGNCRFDRVYCHEFLVPYLESQNEHMWNYLFDDYGDNVWVQFDKADLPKFEKYEIVGVKDGHKFDLGGGYEMELFYQGGHSAGHIALLDKQNRVVFTGDNIICDTSSLGSVDTPRPTPHGENCMLSVYRDNLKRLVAREADFDHVYPSHFMVDVDKSVLPNEIEALDEILANPSGYDYKLTNYGKFISSPGAKPSYTYAKHIKGFAVILYSSSKQL